MEGVTYPYLRQLTAEEKEPTESEMTLYFVDGGDISYVALSEYMPFHLYYPLIRRSRLPITSSISR